MTIAATEAVAYTAATTGLMTFEVVNGFALVAGGVTAATTAAATGAPTIAFFGTLVIAMLSPALILGGAVAAGHEVSFKNHPFYLRDN